MSKFPKVFIVALAFAVVSCGSSHSRTPIDVLNDNDVPKDRKEEVIRNLEGSHTRINDQSARQIEKSRGCQTDGECVLYKGDCGALLAILKSELPKDHIVVAAESLTYEESTQEKERSAYKYQVYRNKPELEKECLQIYYRPEAELAT